MSTPFNNQWVLGRLRARWRKRDHAAGSGTPGEPPASLPELPHEPLPEQQPPASKSHAKHAPRNPAHTIRERPRAASSRTARKHPRWIDRDT